MVKRSLCLFEYAVAIIQKLKNKGLPKPKIPCPRSRTGQKISNITVKCIREKKSQNHFGLFIWGQSRKFGGKKIGVGNFFTLSI